ncbi:MAG: hypothetical protein AAFN92_11955, partial [Bacteroidota bacterium]
MSTPSIALSSTVFAAHQNNWLRWPTGRIGEALQGSGVHPEDARAWIPAHVQRAGRYVFPSPKLLTQQELGFLRFHLLARRGPDELSGDITAQPIIYPGVQVVYGQEKSKVFPMTWEPVRLDYSEDDDESPGTSRIARDTAYLFCTQFCACPDAEVGGLFEANHNTVRLRANHFDFRSGKKDRALVQVEIAEKLVEATSITLN